MSVRCKAYGLPYVQKAAQKGKKKMKRKWLYTAAAVTILAASVSFPNLSATAEEKGSEDNKSVIYKQEDSAASESDAAVHNDETDIESLEDISKVPIIIYELGDPRVPAVSESDAVVHDLNKNETDLQSVEDKDDRPIIVYELGDTKVPVIDWSNTDHLNFLEEPVGADGFAPSVFYNLVSGSCNFSFSNVHQYVITNTYFSTNGNGYISVSTSGINNSVRISMIEYGSDKVVGSWEGDPQTVSGVSFPGNPSKFYYFKFEPCDIMSITGICGVFWDKIR